MNHYLLQPVPRIHAIVGVGLALCGTAFVYAAAKQTMTEGDLIIFEQQERMAMANETINFLLERANDSDLGELNEKLDYWRVVFGHAPAKENT